MNPIRLLGLLSLIAVCACRLTAEDSNTPPTELPDGLIQRIESAQAAILSSRYEDALTALDGGLSRPDDALLFARAARHIGRYDDGLAALNPFINDPLGVQPTPGVPGRIGQDILCEYGELLMKKGALASAASLFDVAWRTTKHARARQFRHRIAQLRGEADLEKAIIDEFYDLYDETPVDTDEPMIFAYTARVIEDESPADESPANALNEGYATAQKLLERRKIFEPEAYLWAGDLLLKYYAYGQVAQEYKVVLEQAPGHPDAIIGSAALYLARGDFQKAKDRIDAALKINPEIGRAHV